MTIQLHRILFLISFFLLTQLAYSQITWDGGAGDGLWSSANNWNPNGVPGDTDDVQIIGSVNVTVNATDSCRSLIIQPANSNPSSIVLTITNGARLGVGTTITVNDRAQGNNAASIVINGGSTLLCGGTFTMLKDNGNNNNNDMTVTIDDNNSRLIVGEDINMTSTAGNTNSNDFFIHMEENSLISCDNFIVTLNDDLVNNNSILSINASGVAGDAAIVNIGSDFTITNNSNVPDFIVDMDFGAQLNVGNNFTYSALNGGSFQLLLDRDAVIDIDNNMTITKDGDEEINIHLNQNNAGTGADAHINIGGNLSVTQTDGDELRIYLDEDSGIDVTGTTSFSKSGADNAADDF